MGFHRRHIDNNQVITLFREGGINRVKDWYTKGADALVTESGLASLIVDILDVVGISDLDKWDKISEEIKNEII
jgi:hypothetical protein